MRYKSTAAVLEASQETTRERAARQRLERKEELTVTESDEQRWQKNRERVIAEQVSITPNKQQVQADANTEQPPTTGISYEQNQVNAEADQANHQNINDIFAIISNNVEEKGFLINPAGKCFDAARYIGQFLRDELNIVHSDIKYRFMLITKPGMTSKDINMANNYNHMIVLLKKEGVDYVFDPTITQFHNIDTSFYGTESEWLEVIKPLWDGVVVKKAIQYMDYNDYMSADNASVAYRMNFDAMKDAGGIFINYPKWYQDYYDKTFNTQPIQPKKKKSKPFIFSCFNSKVAD